MGARRNVSTSFCRRFNVLKIVRCRFNNSVHTVSPHRRNDIQPCFLKKQPVTCSRNRTVWTAVRVFANTLKIIVQTSLFTIVYSNRRKLRVRIEYSPWNALLTFSCNSNSFNPDVSLPSRSGIAARNMYHGGLKLVVKKKFWRIRFRAFRRFYWSKFAMSRY